MAGKYQRTIERVFKKKIEELSEQVDDPYEEDIPFHRDDLEQAIDELEISIGNVPDIPYAYRSRRELPASMRQHGYNAIVIDDSRAGEDPTYLFTKKEQIIQIPDDVDTTRTIDQSALPEPVQQYIREDEQGVLTQIRYADLLDEFTDLDCYHLSSHVRFRVKGREAELDDLYIGLDEEGDHHAIAVEAKGKGEKLNRNQLIRNTRGLENKTQYPNSVTTLAVKLDEDGAIYILEFEVFQKDGNDRVSIDRIWKFVTEKESETQGHQNSLEHYEN